MADKKEPVAPPNDESPDEYGWEFHKIPLLIALILTVIFYIIVYWLASLRG